jgi:hypothetical protein
MASEQVRLRFSVNPNELIDGDRIESERIRGFTAGDLRELQDTYPDIHIESVAESDMGVGASAPGLEVVIDIVGVVGGIEGVIALGHRIKDLVGWIKRKRRRQLLLPESRSAAALSAIETQPNSLGPGWQLIESRMVGPKSGAGMDGRWIYRSVFSDGDWTQVRFMAADGNYLGATSLAHQAFGHHKMVERATQSFAEWAVLLRETEMGVAEAKKSWRKNF